MVLLPRERHWNAKHVIVKKSFAQRAMQEEVISRRMHLNQLPIFKQDFYLLFRVQLEVAVANMPG